MELNPWAYVLSSIDEIRDTGFVFSVDYSIMPATDQFVNGLQPNNRWINDKFHFVNVLSSDKTYKIISMATGRG